MFVQNFIKIPFAVFGWSNWTKTNGREKEKPNNNIGASNCFVAIFFGVDNHFHFSTHQNYKQSTNKTNFFR